MSKTLTVFFTALTFAVFAVPTKAMLGARNSVGGGKSVTAKDYVQDGLVAMWDGIENAGWGVHDPAATVWKDLIGGDAITPTILDGGVASFIGDALLLDNAVAISQASQAINTESPFTVEVVMLALQASDYVITTHAYYSIYSLEIGLYQSVLSVGVRGQYVPIKSGIASGNIALVVDGSMQICYADGTPYNTRSRILNYGRLPISLNYSADRTPTPTNVGRLAINAIRLYSRALTAAEIAANYAVDKERFGLP